MTTIKAWADNWFSIRILSSPGTALISSLSLKSASERIEVQGISALEFGWFCLGCGAVKIEKKRETQES